MIRDIVNKERKHREHDKKKVYLAWNAYIKLQTWHKHGSYLFWSTLYLLKCLLRYFTTRHILNKINTNSSIQSNDDECLFKRENVLKSEYLSISLNEIDFFFLFFHFFLSFSQNVNGKKICLPSIKSNWK